MSGSIAFMDLGSGRAVISEPDGRNFHLEPSFSEPKVCPAGFHFGMYLQPAMNSIEERNAGTYPYAELHAYLRAEHKKRQATVFARIVGDGDISLRIRLELLKEGLEPFLKDPEVEAFVLADVRSRPPRDEKVLAGLPNTGKFSNILKAMRREG